MALPARIIADYLLARGVSVRHILGEARVEDAKPTPFLELEPVPVLDGGDGPVAHEQAGRLHRLVQQPAGAPAQVEDQAGHARLVQAGQGPLQLIHGRRKVVSHRFHGHPPA